MSTTNTCLPRAPIHFLKFHKHFTQFLVAGEYGFQLFDCRPLASMELIDYTVSKNNNEILNQTSTPLTPITCSGTTTSNLVQDEKWSCVEILANEYVFVLSKDDSGKIQLWDDSRHEFKGIEFQFPSKVLNFEVSKHYLLIVGEQNTSLINLLKVEKKNIHSISTHMNSKGLGCIVQSIGNKLIVATLGLQVGHVRIRTYNSPELFSDIIINAHEHSLAALVLNADGTLLATASDRGTCIRIFKTEDGSLFQEFRRGTLPAKIYSLAFNSTNEWFACTSDHSTVHIFMLNKESSKIDEEKKVENVNNNSNNNSNKNSNSIWWFASDYLPKFFQSQWCFASFTLPSGSAPHIVGFCNEDIELPGENTLQISILSISGYAYNITLDVRSPKDYLIHPFTFASFPGSKEDLKIL